MIWHNSSAEEVTRLLDVDEKKGLANGVADIRLEKYGRNIISCKETPGFLKRFFEQLKSKTVIVLFIVAIISFIVSLVYEQVNSYSPLLIIGIVIINSAISAFHILRCDKTLENMKSVSNPKATVLRDGIIKVINSETLVPGDILILQEGDYISADARIIDCNEFRCNESVITGEEVPVEKLADIQLENITPIEQRSNMVFSGCSVVHGSAKAIVVATGVNTESGHSAAIMQQTGESRLPVEGKLESLGKIVNVIIIIICALVFVISMIQNFSTGSFASMTMQSLVNAVALAVAAIPEGISAMATVVFALGISRIMQDNIIIKDSAALEQIGKTTVICADKTGILTRNKMQLSHIFDGKKITECEKESLDDTASMILRLAATCSTLENDFTEKAIESACLAYNSISRADIESMSPRLSVIPFDSVRKTMTSINMINEKPFAIVKGAAEIVLPKCTGCDPEQLLKVNDLMANEALRVVCIAIKPLESIPANPNADEIETELTFVGLLGLIDPPREDVIESIESCDKAGIRTVMITGDNLITAKSVARRIGILKDGTEAITGAELETMTDEELEENIEKYSVFARVSPEDKLRVVKALQKNKDTVTVTGDNIADADALSAADIGCAMGKYGTDVARGNADIIITNSRFSSVVAAIKESRGLFANIKKSLFYMLSCNLAELATVIFGVLIFGKMPVSAVLLLWINLLTDSATAISLSMERAETIVMDKGNKGLFSRLVGSKELISMSAQSIFMTVTALVAFAIGINYGYSVAITMTFLTMGLSQILNVYNHKTMTSIFVSKLFSNQFMNYSNILIIFIMMFLSLTPAGFVFGLSILNATQLAISVGLSFLIIPLGEIFKLNKK